MFFFWYVLIQTHFWLMISIHTFLYTSLSFPWKIAHNVFDCFSSLPCLSGARGSLHGVLKEAREKPLKNPESHVSSDQNSPWLFVVYRRLYCPIIEGNCNKPWISGVQRCHCSAIGKSLRWRNGPFWDGEKWHSSKVVGDLQRLGIKRSHWNWQRVVYFTPPEI